MVTYSSLSYNMKRDSLITNEEEKEVTNAKLNQNVVK